MHSIGSLRADYPLSFQKVNTQLLTLNNLKKKENCVRSLRRTGTYLVFNSRSTYFTTWIFWFVSFIYAMQLPLFIKSL